MKNSKVITSSRYSTLVKGFTSLLELKARSKEQLVCFEQLTSYNSDFWNQWTAEQAGCLVKEAIISIKANLTLEERKHRRKAFLTSILKMNSELQLGKLKGISLRLLGAKKMAFKL